MVVWVPGWNETKRGKTLAALSCLFIIYIYMFMHCENKRLLNACMTENRMCVFAESKLWMLERLIPCPIMDMNELIFLLGRHEKYESLLDETWTVIPIG